MDTIEAARDWRAAAGRAMAEGDVRAAVTFLERARGSGRPDAVLLLQLATAYRRAGDLSRALEAAREGVETEPRNWLALLMLGSLFDATGAPDRAGKTYRETLRHAPPPSAVPPPLASQLEHARRRADAEEAWQRSVFDWSDGTALASASEEERRHIVGFRDSLLRNAARGPETQSQFSIPDMPAQPFYDPTGFPGVAAMAAEVDTLFREFQQLVGGLGLGPFTGNVDAKGRGQWSMIPLIREGEVREEFARFCPETLRLHAAIEAPELGSISPSLYFSVLEPGGYIAPHTGISNARLIVHCPLAVPPGCWFRVGDATRQWDPGVALVFDDMVEHEAANPSDGTRVVLIADVWRPDLTALERRLITELLAHKPVA